MKEFSGKLESIPPSKIIDKDKSSDFDNFFLVLGLIYNDMKDLLLFSNLFNDTYRRPLLDSTEPASAHSGEWGGINNHINRLLISFISEFLIFLDKNKAVMGTIQFRLIEKKLPLEIRNDWSKILRVLDGNGGDDFLNKIARIRSNVSFHYDQSLSELRTGYIKKFITSEQNVYNNKAYYSMGGSMETTRFYYSDGAAEEYIKEHMKATAGEDYFKKIRELVERTNRTIIFMMEQYLKLKIK